MSTSSNEEITEPKIDTRPSCKYGSRCYMKNEIHLKKYKHPGGHNPKKPDSSASRSPPRKKLKQDRRTPPKQTEEIEQSNGSVKDKEDMKIQSNADKSSHESFKVLDILIDYKIEKTNNHLSEADARTVLPHLFLTAMPEEFYQLYEFCKSYSENDPLSAFKDADLKLVGPYSVFEKNFLDCKISSKEAFLRHWRYFYDPPEFQTVLSVLNKDGLHFGYWRDEPDKDPVFIAKNQVNVDCLITPVATNIFGAIDSYLTDKIKTANPFKKTSIKRLQQKLKKFAEEKSIKLEKTNNNMQARAKKVVAKTFHKAGIIVPYDKRTDMGYRELAISEKDLQKLLQNIDKAATPEARKSLMSKLQEVVRLATIAADECDFGTCLELGHDLFSSGVSHVHSIALQMLNTAYSLLDRPAFESIIKEHLGNRSKDVAPSVIET